MQAPDRRAVVAPQVLILPLFGEVRGVERFEADEQAAQPGVDRPLQQARREHRVDGAGGLPEAAHAAHAVEQRRREAAIAEQMIVEEIQVTPGQPLDLGERLRRRSACRTTAPPSKKASL